ncbi:ATP-binding protein [Streptomyces sp. NPDC021093]|uniref:ATP-binding protein n=1 Tax=Streptomyces sp. NPDC021093 TaxID=3365112 RepID=UPI0037B1ADAA
MVPGSTLFPQVMGPIQGARVRRFGFALPACPESVAHARHLTAARLTVWGLGADVGDTAALVVSELVTNAVIHTGSDRVRCELADGDGRLRISVRDEGIGPQGPRLRRSAEAAGEHGRGLLLVDALCDTWGSQENGPDSGRTVWAELPHAETAETGGSSFSGDGGTDPGSVRE